MEIEQLISELQERNRKLGKWINEDQICFYREELDQITTDTARQAYQAGIDEAVEIVEREQVLNYGRAEWVSKDNLLQALQDNK